MLRTRSVLPAVLAAALGAWAAGAAHHEKAEAEEAAPVAAESPWDQAKVTELVKDLHAKVVTIRKAERNAPPDTIASGQARARKQLNDNFRMIDRESKHLVRRLEEGKGREEGCQSGRVLRRVAQRRTTDGHPMRTVLALLFLLISTASADDWFFPRGDVQNTGVVKNRGPKKKPSIKWQREEKGAISTGAALSAGRLVFGVGEFVVACRRANGGAHIWDAKVKCSTAKDCQRSHAFHMILDALRCQRIGPRFTMPAHRGDDISNPLSHVEALPLLCLERRMLFGSILAPAWGA